MQTIKIHQICEDDTIKSLTLKYKCTYDDIVLFNPTIKHKSLSLGQILYIPYEEIESLDIKIDDNYKNIFSIINYLNELIYLSKINKFNNYLKLENELYYYQQEISKKIFKEENYIQLFSSHLKNIHLKIIMMIDYLLEKDESKINLQKKSILENVKSLSLFLNFQKVNFNEATLFNYYENKIISAIKMLNNNYYEAHDLLKIHI